MGKAEVTAYSTDAIGEGEGFGLASKRAVSQAKDSRLDISPTHNALLLTHVISCTTSLTHERAWETAGEMFPIAHAS